MAVWPFRKKRAPIYVPTSAEIDAYLKELRRQREAGELTRAEYDERRTQAPPPPPPSTAPPSTAPPSAAPPSTAMPSAAMPSAPAPRVANGSRQAVCAVCERDQRFWERALFLWHTCDGSDCDRMYCASCYARLPRVRGGHVADRECRGGHPVSGHEPRPT